MPFCSLLHRLRTDRGGSTLPVLAMGIFVCMVAAGVAIDYGNATRQKAAIQNIGDKAILAVARGYDPTIMAFALNEEVDAHIAANIGAHAGASRDGDVTYVAATSELCLKMQTRAKSSLVGIIGIPDIPVDTTSCVHVGDGGTDRFEIALVVDVSASMADKDRLTALRRGLRAFLAEFEGDEDIRGRTRIALVPYASRINIGLGQTDWLVSHDGIPPIPDRWVRASEEYSDAVYDELTWTDGVTRGYASEHGVHWLGCVEPRSDASQARLGAVSRESLLDAPPNALGLVAMDANTGSDFSACPPPIVPLSANFMLIDKSIGALTTQGATRLDAGLLGGWYAVSPRWTGLWGDPETPRPAAPDVRKVVVFLTDGRMETEHGQSEYKLDWLCRSSDGVLNRDCDATATAQMTAVCEVMKASGVEVFGISYGEDADRAAVAACASSGSHHFTATASSSSTHGIAAVYIAIAEALMRTSLRLSR